MEEGIRPHVGRRAGIDLVALHEELLDARDLVDPPNPGRPIWLSEHFAVDVHGFALEQYGVAQLRARDQVERLGEAPLFGGEGRLFDRFAPEPRQGQVIGAGHDLRISPQVEMALPHGVFRLEPGEHIRLGALDVGGEIPGKRLVLLVVERLRGVEPFRKVRFRVIDFGDGLLRLLGVVLGQTHRRSLAHSISVTTGSPSRFRSFICRSVTKSGRFRGMIVRFPERGFSHRHGECRTRYSGMASVSLPQQQRVGIYASIWIFVDRAAIRNGQGSL